MEYTNQTAYQQVPFWDFIRNFDPNAGAGAGVDHQREGGFFGQGRGGPAGPPPPPGFGGFGFPFGGPGFGPGACGRGGRRGRHHRREGSHGPDHEHHGSRDVSPDHEHPEGEGEGEAREGSPHGHGHHGPYHGRRGGMGRGGWGGRGWGRGGWGGHPRQGPFPGAGGFDLPALIETLSAHPLAQAFRSYAEQAAGKSGETLVPDENETENTFTPPIDVFSTPTSYILHVALPGAKKEDVGVNWDAEKGVLNLAGVVYRQGDEALLKTLSQAERKVGVFERTVKLPPGAEEKEEVDGGAITAKLEDGVLIVAVPKVEKEWTEVKRVDIE